MNRCRAHGPLEPDATTCDQCDDTQRDQDNACPECPTGAVIAYGDPEWDTGHQPYGCTAGCGYGG